MFKSSSKGSFLPCVIAVALACVLAGTGNAEIRRKPGVGPPRNPSEPAKDSKSSKDARNAKTAISDDDMADDDSMTIKASAKDKKKTAKKTSKEPNAVKGKPSRQRVTGQTLGSGIVASGGGISGET